MHGIAVINKASGITSFGVVERVRKVLKVKKVGHFGTLDPMASGVLLIGIGNATRLFDFYVAKKKSYTGIVRFGFSTTTFDIEGEINSPQVEVDLNNFDLEKSFVHFKGRLTQRTPIFSAKKFRGKPLYHYARNGLNDVQPPVNEIEIYDFQYRVIKKDLLEIKVSCSAGTYIRTLADDLGQALGTGAHLVSLCRNSVGDFDLQQAQTVEEFENQAAAGNLLQIIIPFERLLPELPALEVDYEGRKLVQNGVALKKKNILRIINSGESDHYRIFDSDGHFLAISLIDRQQQLFKPFLVFNY